MLMLCNMELLYRVNVLLDVARVLHYIQFSGFGLTCPNHFVSLHVEDEGVLL